MLERHAFLELVHCVEPRAAAIIRVRSKKESRLIPIFTIFRPLFFCSSLVGFQFIFNAQIR